MSIQLTGKSMQQTESNFEFGFFRLENNHDKAVVRFLHEDYEDFSRRPVHFVKVPGQKYSVSINCLRPDNGDYDMCPFCNANIDTSIVSKRSKRIYIEFLVYKILDRDGKVIQDWTSKPRKMVWERERRFDDKIFSLSSRFNPLCDTVFQVERFGEKGSTSTEYDIYPINVNNEDYPYNLPEKLYNPDGVQVEDKTIDEMNYYLENEYNFPPKDGEIQVTRRSDVVQKSETTVIERREASPVVKEEPKFSVMSETVSTAAPVSRRRSI